ncbi:hypothetical protein CJ030_MR8G020062 [Morella rubra]|uniref:Uncharacterized protein n=1 Tax=Morella rubra TaxID=262757 RepID=A0A6A1UN44_9ROSI|nr:hypothetical protein CJ030_MR8G020062 [Morella rubra]
MPNVLCALCKFIAKVISEREISYVVTAETRHGAQASSLPLTKDVLGIVATLGQLEDDNLSRLFAEYLGVETMLAIVCKTYEGVKALETYYKEGCIKKSSGLHGLGASIGRTLDD